MDHIPELSEHLLIEAIEKDQYYFVHQTQTNFRLKINNQTKYLLSLIDGQNNISAVTTLFNARFKSNMTPEGILHLIKDKLEPYGIVQTGENPQKKDRADYLRLRFIIIPSKVVSDISNVFKFLIVDKIWVGVIGLLTALIVVYTFTFNFDKFGAFINPSTIIGFFPIALLSLLWHELGHASACKKFNIVPGSIGFGFYILVPVFYADVSDVWKISPSKRIVVNIAGMYFQLLLSTVLVILYFISSNEWLLYASVVNSIGILPNLNPFVRYDGYWILSDLLSLNNLMDKADEKYKATLNWIRNRKALSFPIKTSLDKFLFIYFFLNKAMVGVILFSIAFLKPDSLLYFPKRFALLINSLIEGSEIFSFTTLRDFFIDNFIAVLFYIMLLKVLKNLLMKLKSNRRNL